MAFSEATKLEAKRLAHFECVICHKPFVEVHHIIPQADGGDDDIDNAAALCAYCHDLFGSNPDKRKQIRQMRDLWYELCENRFRESPSLDLAEDLEDLKSRQEEQGAMIREMKEILARYYAKQTSQLSAASTASAVEALSGVSIPQPRRTRWLRSPMRASDLNNRKVFARLITASGRGYEGVGTIRARHNPEGFLAVDLTFIVGHMNNIASVIFHISSRQLPHLVPVQPTADFDYKYEGTLEPDNEPDGV